MSDANDSASEKNGENDAEARREERDRLCDALQDFVEHCRTSERAIDLGSLRDAYRAIHGVPVLFGEQERKRLAVRVAGAMLREARKARARRSPDYEAFVHAIPVWLAQDVDEPRFASARIDEHVRDAVERQARGSKGAQNLVALLAIRVGAFGMDPEGPAWFDQEEIEKYARNNLKSAVQQAAKNARRRLK